MSQQDHMWYRHLHLYGLQFEVNFYVILNHYIYILRNKLMKILWIIEHFNSFNRICIFSIIISTLMVLPRPWRKYGCTHAHSFSSVAIHLTTCIWTIKNINKTKKHLETDTLQMEGNSKSRNTHRTYVLIKYATFFLSFW